MRRSLIKVNVRGKPEDTCCYIEAVRQKDLDLHMVECLDEAVTFFIRKQDIRQLRMVKRQRVKVYFITRPISNYVKKQLVQHMFTVILSLCSLVCYLYLTQILLIVKIDVDNPFDEIAMRETLESLNVMPLHRIDGLPDHDRIRLALKEHFPTYRYFDIARKGGVMTITGEGDIIADIETNNRYAYYAPKKGLITSLIAYQGRKCVEVNQVVEQGDLLITGELNEKITEEDQPDDVHESKRVPIRAELTLNTWFKVTGSYHTEVLFDTINNTTTHYYRLRLNDWTIPLTFQGKITPPKAIIEQFSLPWLALSVEKILEMTPYTMKDVLDQEALYELAQQQLRERILHEPHVKEVYDEKVLHQSIENGKVNVTVFFSVLETYQIE